MRLARQSHGAKRPERPYPEKLDSRIVRFAWAITPQSLCFEPRTGAGSPSRSVGRCFLILTVTLTFLTGFCRAQAAEPWPEGLKEAASSHLADLQARELKIRDSSMLEPLGVVPANIFDRASHKCHEGSGQQYRQFGQPVYIGRGDDGVHLVQTAIQVFYRQGAGLAELYEQPWRTGTDMVFQISFHRKPGGWQAVLERELIDMDQVPRDVKESGHPDR